MRNWQIPHWIMKKKIINILQTLVSVIVCVIFYITYIPYSVIKGLLDMDCFRDYLETVLSWLGTIISNLRLYFGRNNKKTVNEKIEEYLKLYFFDEVKCVINEIIVSENDMITIKFSFSDNDDVEMKELEVPLSELESTRKMMKYINEDRERRHYGGYCRYNVL